MNAHRRVGAAARPPLPCEFGWHKTDALALWNDGYYFSKCARCGQDLVRTAFGRWTVPRGFRVVWAAQPPKGAPAVHLVPERDAGAASADPIAFPIAGAATADATAETRSATIGADEPAADAEARRPVATADSVKRTDPREAVGERSLRYLFPNVQDVDPVATVVPEVSVDPPTSEPRDVESATPTSEAATLDEPSTPSGREDTLVADPPVTAVAANEVSADPAPAFKPLIPDFMDASVPLEVPYDLTTGRILPPEERPGTPEDAEVAPPAVPPASLPRGVRVGERVRTAATSARAFVDARASSKTGRAAVSPRAFLERHAGLVAASVFGAFVVVAATIDRSDAPAGYRPLVRAAEPARVPAARPQRVAAVSTPEPISVAPTPPVAAPPAIAPPVPTPPVPTSPATEPLATPTPQPAAAREAEPAPRKATVTASILRCRAKPDDDSATVRKLTRGVSVELVAGNAGPGWVGVTQNGKKCWVSERYLSRTRRA